MSERFPLPSSPRESRAETADGDVIDLPRPERVRDEQPSAAKILTAEKESSVMTEERFLHEIDRLKQQAGKIAASWMSKYEEAKESDLPQLFNKFEEFLQKRENALFSLEIPDGLDPRIATAIKHFDKNVTMSFGNGTLFQGNGATAEVYEVAGHPEFCWKFVTNQEKYNVDNHIRVEFNLLNKMRGLQRGRVRTPEAYFLRIHPRDGHSFGMERVEGKNLSQILEHPEQFPEFVKIAKQMDRTQVLQEVTDFVHAMHTEKGITHGDLFRRNIMLDRTGALFIIDFGKAKRHESDTNTRDMAREKDIACVNSEVQSFFKGIDNLYI